MNKKYIIITSIFSPTEAVEKFSKYPDWNMIVVGDKKTTEDWSYPNVEFISASEQLKMDSPFVKSLPWNSYTRKNIGYARAISRGAQVIYDTDDDNMPLDNWIREPSFEVKEEVIDKPAFVNIYSFFTEMPVWPRGLPLQCILGPVPSTINPKEPSKVGVWQYLADEDPDVDAIYRLTNNTPVYFNKRKPFVLDKGVCCPFNSQNTYFRSEVFPLLYLPSTVTFRFTDILRGLVAQPILWAAGYRLGFGEATVIQKRNPHNYLNDFESEVPGYLFAEKVVILAKESVSDNCSISENLVSVYEALQKNKIVTELELKVLELWLKNFTENS
ncbi:MAG: DUF288 domain-containing protein [Candidatus Scalindua sp.]|jgi:hypothetical protein|nr:DUF288 domain-containing protein [Candidatus Scalindua sp.]